MAGASSDVMDRIHRAMAAYLLGLFEPVPRLDEDGEPVLDAAGEPITDQRVLSSAELGVIAKFLKDNNISALDDDDDDVQALRQELSDGLKDKSITQSDLDLAIEAASHGRH